MARLTPEEIIEKFGHLHPETSSLCQTLCDELQSLLDEEQRTPSPVLQKRLVALAKQIQANHCKCFPH